MLNYAKRSHLTVMKQPYYVPINEQYLLAQPKNLTQENKAPSLEDMLEMDNHRLLDKVVTTALSISYRLKLYREGAYMLTNQWNELSKRIGQYPSNNTYEKRTLYKERDALEQSILDQKMQTWKDLNEPVSYFVELFHKREESLADKKILGEEN